MTSKYPSLQGESHAFFSCSKTSQQNLHDHPLYGLALDGIAWPNLWVGDRPVHFSAQSLNIVTSVWTQGTKCCVPPHCEKPDLPFPSHARSVSEERALAQESGNQRSSPKRLNILPLTSCHQLRQEAFPCEHLQMEDCSFYLLWRLLHFSLPAT